MSLVVAMTGGSGSGSGNTALSNRPQGLVADGVEVDVHAVLVADRPDAPRIERTMRRCGPARSQVEEIVARQASRQRRSAIAGHVVNGAGALEPLAVQVTRLHRSHPTLAERGAAARARA